MEEWEEQMERLYRKVFGTVEGKLVLADILVDLGFFNTVNVTDQVEIGLQNFARMLLSKIGAWNAENVHNIVGTLLAIPTRRRKEDGEQE
jgi:hypothetical protein